ncbi:putative aminoacyl-tRNA synthetase, class Ia, anticodon-binding protein [Helianthus anomalus]
MRCPQEVKDELKAYVLSQKAKKTNDGLGDLADEQEDDEVIDIPAHQNKRQKTNVKGPLDVMFSKDGFIIQRSAIVDLKFLLRCCQRSPLCWRGFKFYTKELPNSACSSSTVDSVLPHLAEDVWQNLPFEYHIDNADMAKFVFESKWPAVNERWLAFPEEEIDFWGKYLSSSSLQAALIGDQKKFRENEPRSVNIIEDITQDDIESLSIKLETVRFEQVLENEKGFHPVQRYPFEKRKVMKKQLVQNMSRRLNKRLKQVKGKMIRKLYPKY